MLVARVSTREFAFGDQWAPVSTEPRPLTLPSGTTMRLAFIEGPDGVRIELVQRC